MVKRQQIQAELVKVQGTLGRLSKETKRGHCIEANGNSIETIKSAKVLGVTIRGNLKWNDHIDNSESICLSKLSALASTAYL